MGIIRKKTYRSMSPCFLCLLINRCKISYGDPGICNEIHPISLSVCWRRIAQPDPHGCAKDSCLQRVMNTKDRTWVFMGNLLLLSLGGYRCVCLARQKYDNFSRTINNYQPSLYYPFIAGRYSSSIYCFIIRWLEKLGITEYMDSFMTASHPFGISSISLVK